MALRPEQYLRPDVIQQVRRLDLKARFIVEGFLSGLHGSPLQGFSVEFSEHRKYTPGDDIRQVDWNVFARTDRFFVRKYQAETSLDAWLLVDCSGSMDFALGGRLTKMDYAICLAAALGYLMIGQQDSVGLFCFDEKLRAHLPARCRRSHLTRILATLAQTKPFGRTRLAAALHDVAARVKKRGLMILLSDLLDEPDAVLGGLHHLRFRGHDVLVLQVLDYSEVAFDFDGQVRFEDPETGQSVTADPRAIRASYRAEMDRFIADYRRRCRAARADFTTVHNAMTFDKALVEFLLQRRARF